MANNGGTSLEVPQTDQCVINNSCNSCGLSFDSSESLRVHIHYHHSNTENSISRWGQVTNNNNINTNGATNIPTPRTSSNSSPTDSENNNQPKHHQVKSSGSPVNFTISAAADSSDNQPLTPQSTASGDHQIRSQGFTNNNNTNYNNHQLSAHYHQQQSQTQPHGHQQPPADMHYPSYMTNYDQYYQHSMDYGLPPPPTHYSNQSEYKTVPSSNRFHPYGSVGNNLPSVPYPLHVGSQQNQLQIPTAISASSVPSTMSPTVVTSSSPIQNNLMHSTTAPSMANPQNSNVMPGQTDASTPSPRQDKNFGCENPSQLNDHQSNAHNSHNSSNNTNDTNISRSSGGNDIENDIPAFQYSNYNAQIKEEPQQQQQPPQQQQQQPADCDILDLDSQKMVYPPHDVNQQGPLPSMHSLHSMQRPSMMWPHAHHDSNSFLPVPPASHNPSDLKTTMFVPLKNEFGSQIIKPDHLTQSSQTQLPADIPKSFRNDGNQVTTSPSEFPSTTTPQENSPQFRTFEATSSLPNGAPLTKATSWKSNEARRPKTYNCTACNKWFTSSGHLKRHYNTTLHKNAVKSSGQPDPATLPISVHHHPARDPIQKSSNRYNKSAHNNNSIAQQQPSVVSIPQSNPIPPLVNDTPRTPDYSSQFTSFVSQTQSANPIGFQQYQSQNAMQSMVHPNAQAGLCDYSQPRDLLTYSSITGVHSTLHNSNHLVNIQELHQQRHSSVQDFIQMPQMQSILPESMHSINTMEQQQQQQLQQPMHCNITTPITINTNITQLYQPLIRQEDTSYTIIGNQNINESHADMLSSNSSNSGNSIDIPMSNYMQQQQQQQQQQQNHHHQQDQQSHQQYQPIIKSEFFHGDQSHQQSSHENYSSISDDIEPNKPYSTEIPAIAALRRLNNDIYHADTVPPFSPDMPAPYNRALTPQTGETVPGHLSPNAPITQQHYTTLTDLQPPPSSKRSIKQEPSSPSITSTNSQIGQLDNNLLTDNCHKSNKNINIDSSKSKTKSTKRRTAVDTAKLITDTIPVGNDPLRCEPCDKVFNKACYLTQHNKTFHSGEKPFKCQRCGKRFPCDQSHDEHMAKHLGNKPFKCSLCTKQFNHKTDLRRHMCLHTGTKPYICDVCNKGFIRKDHMVKHGLTHLKRKNTDVKKSPNNDDEHLEPGKQSDNFNKKRKLNKKREIVCEVVTLPMVTS